MKFNNVKNLILQCLTCCLSVFYGASQGGGVDFDHEARLTVYRTPIEANGYLIMNQWKYPDVTTWKIDFQNPEISPTGEVSHFNKVKTVEISGTHYVKMGKNETPDAGFFSVTGLNNQGVKVVTEGPVISWKAVSGDTSYLICKYGCVGKKYAYQINLGRNTSWGYQSIFYPTALIKPEGSSSPYYYEWFSDAQFTQMTKQPGGYWTNFYGLSGKNSELYDENNGHNSSDPFAQRVIRLEGIGAQSGTTYQDAMGNVLSGTIYGIAKSFGEYRNSIPYMESALLAGVEEHCLGFDYALNRINSNKAFWRGGDGTSLGCNGRTFAGDDDGAGGTEGTEDNDFGVGDINIGNGPCKVVIISYTSPVTGEIIQYEDCIDVPGYGGGVPNLPAEAQIITLFGLDPDTPIAPIVLKNKQNTREMLDGSPYPDNTPLPEGLYYALFQMENGSFVTQIFEAEHKKELSNKVPLSAKLNALVSPNPAYQKNVNLKMTSVENLAFQISGITPGGLEFVKYQVSLKENEEKHLLVLLPSNAAPGTYTLIFTFSDSSTLTKHIVKL